MEQISCGFYPSISLINTLAQKCIPQGEEISKAHCGKYRNFCTAKRRNLLSCSCFFTCACAQLTWQDGVRRGD